jgi:hypothetical protein
LIQENVADIDDEDAKAQIQLHFDNTLKFARGHKDAFAGFELAESKA